MTRRVLATALLAALMTLPFPAVAGASVASAGPGVVALVLAPYLTWDDVVSGHTPFVEDLAAVGAVGNMNASSRVPHPGRRIAENGALMISAGDWTRFDSTAPGARETSGPVAVVYDGASAQVAAQRGAGDDARPGTLGEAVLAAGGTTIAIGDADLGKRPSQVGARTSPAVIAAMDRAGRVRAGSVSPKLLRVVEGPAPMGVLADVDEMRRVLAASLAEASARGGPTLAVIDPGDLARAHAAARPVLGSVEPLDRVAAIENLDATVRMVRAELPSDATLVVAAPVSADQKDTPPGFAPVIVQGTGRAGVLTSPSTRRTGIVTVLDLTPTILGALGADVPPWVVGTSMTVDGAQTNPAQRVESLRDMDGTARSVDAVRDDVIGVFILLSLVALAFSVLSLSSPDMPPWLMRTGHLALLAVLSVPAGALLMFIPVRYPQTPATAATLLVATSLLVWMIAVASHYATGLSRSVAFLAALLAEVLLIDQWLGAPLSFSGFFSYSALVGARYYGLGNEGAALLMGASLTAVAVLFDNNPDRSWVGRARTWGFPLLAAVCVLTAAAPVVGANIGCAIWGTVAFVLAWAAMRGHRIGWKTVLAAAAAVIVVVGAFAALDLALPPEMRTHLGRLLSGSVASGAAPAVAMAGRKLGINLQQLLATSWTWLLIGIAAVLARLALRHRGPFHDMRLENPSLSGVLTATVVAGVVGYFTEDSGVIVPALMLLAPTLAVVYVMLSRKAAEAQA